ncbi:MAG TPA: hypothetical protein VKB59_12620 [Micromonosporaceae bacterium]|nr:hypothetical protein [Micromonosporaceae bacterium]
MRFERRDTPDRIEFWSYELDDPLRWAVERIGWEPRDGGWCRHFDVRAHHADEAFDNMHRLLEPALRQIAGLDAVPWRDALNEVCARLNPAGIDWWLGGSAALAVRGADLVPHDLDLIVSGPDSRRVGDLLVDCLIEPVTRGEWHLSDWWGRAVVGCRVEWAGGVTAASDEPDITDFGLIATRTLESVRWREWQVRVPPLSLQRAVSIRRGLKDRVALIDAIRA